MSAGRPSSPIRAKTVTKSYRLVSDAMGNGKPNEAACLLLRALYDMYPSYPNDPDLKKNPDALPIPRGTVPQVPVELRDLAICILKQSNASEPVFDLFRFLLRGFPTKREGKRWNEHAFERKLPARERAIQYLAENDGATAYKLKDAIGVDWRTASGWMGDPAFQQEVETARAILGPTPAARAKRIADRAARRKNRAASHTALAENISQAIETPAPAEARERPNVD